MVLSHGSEHAFAPALLLLSPADLPASPRQLTVRTCTRHHPIPTPDEDWSGVSPIRLVHLSRNTTSSSSHPHPSTSYLILSTHSHCFDRAAPSAPPLSSRPRQPATASLSFDPTSNHVIATVASKQALNSLSHHYQEQDPAACAFLPSPAALDHTTTTPGTHRRSLSAVLIRPTTCLL